MESTRILVPNGKVHEAAGLFPMLPEDELQELAADIKTNGLIHPIVLDAEGPLIDGRNRLAACRIAGVEPTYTSLNGHDPVSYILSANIERRNLNKGQRAMALARLETKHSARVAGALIDVSAARISQASTVLNHAPNLADSVMSGAVPLDTAYEQARQRKTRAESAEARMATLQAEASELATLVVEERLSVDEAWQMWKKRIQDEENDRRDLTKSTARALISIWAVLAAGPENIVTKWVEDANTERNRDGAEHLWTEGGLRELARTIDELATAVGRRGGLNRDAAVIA